VPAAAAGEGQPGPSAVAVVFTPSAEIPA